MNAPIYNQFTRPRTPELVESILVAHPNGPKVQQLFEDVMKSSDLCSIPNGSGSLWHTFEGQRRRVTVRSILYYLHTKTTPIFGVCTCGNTGCINPLHQSVVGDNLGSTTLEPRKSAAE